MADVAQGWHDFYLLIGSAAAALVGMMFVAASIGATYFSAESEAGLRAFLTPTVLHFTAIIILCLTMIVPTPDPEVHCVLLLAASAIGFVYSANVAIQIRRRGFHATIDRTDRFWYATAPVVSYALTVAAAVLLLTRPALALNLLAVALASLLLLGIRNAWDMTVWLTLRSPNK